MKDRKFYLGENQLMEHELGVPIGSRTSESTSYFDGGITEQGLQSQTDFINVRNKRLQDLIINISTTKDEISGYQKFLNTCNPNTGKGSVACGNKTVSVDFYNKQVDLMAKSQQVLGGLIAERSSLEIEIKNLQRKLDADLAAFRIQEAEKAKTVASTDAATATIAAQTAAEKEKIMAEATAKSAIKKAQTNQILVAGGVVLAIGAATFIYFKFFKNERRKSS